MKKPRIAVIGAGLMGHGIAYLFAAGGHEVRVQDPVAAAREKLPQRLRDICDLLGADRAVAELMSARSRLSACVAPYCWMNWFR